MKTRDITVCGIFVALIIVFDFVGKFIPFLQMPNGGSIDLGSIALLVASFSLGWKRGTVIAILAMLVTFMFNPPYIVSLPQFLLDYLLPWLATGTAAIWLSLIKGKYSIYIAVTIAMVLRFLCNLFAGVFFWFPEGEAAGSIGAWIYSLNYNAGYNIATMVVALILVPIIYNVVVKNKLIKKIAK